MFGLRQNFTAGIFLLHVLEKNYVSGQTLGQPVQASLLEKRIFRSVKKQISIQPTHKSQADASKQLWKVSVSVFSPTSGGFPFLVLTLLKLELGQFAGN